MRWEVNIILMSVISPGSVLPGGIELSHKANPYEIHLSVDSHPESVFVSAL